MARRVRLTVLALLVVSGTLLAVLGFPASVASVGDDTGYLAFQVLLEVAGVAWLVPGVVLLLRDDRHPVGWCLVWVGVANLVQYNDLLFAPYDSPWVAFANDEWLSESFFAALATVVAVFPDGLAVRPRPARRRWQLGLSAAWGMAVLMVFVQTVGGNEESPFQRWPSPLPFAFVPRWLQAVAFPVTAATLLAAVVGLVLRARRQTSAERRRYRMVQWAMAVMMGSILLGFVLGLIWPWTSDTGVAFVPAVASFVLLPTAIMGGILRYGLYDIDRVVSRTVTYAVVAVVVTVAYVVPVLLLSLAFGRGNDLVVAVATLTAAVVVAPVRRRVQAIVDRRFNRSRYDATREAAAFAARMRAEVELAAVVDDLEVVVQRTLAPTSTSLWLAAAADPARPVRTQT